MYLNYFTSGFVNGLCARYLPSIDNIYRQRQLVRITREHLNA
jgi:hypothetical protein